MTDEPTIPPSIEPDPSVPPPIPPAMLGYAGPMPPPVPTGKLNFYQQAAKASWLAPVIAMGISMCTNSSTRGGTFGNPDKYVSLTMSIISAGLLVLGFTFGIVALCGVRRHGKHKILTPAIVGIALNGLFLSLIVWVFVAFAARARVAARTGPPAISARAPVTAQQARDSMEKSPGWVGHMTKDGAFIVVVSIGPDTPLGQEIKDLFGTDRLAFAIIVNNSASTDPITVNASDFSVVLKDWTIHPALSPQEVFKAARLNANTLKTAYPPSVSIPARAPAASSVAAFLPIDIDPTQIDHATLIINGKLLTIPGKFQSVEEKAANIARAGAAATRPAGQ